MAVTAAPYGKFLLALGTGAFNFSSDTFKVLLCTSTYVPDLDTHEFLTSITNEVANGNGYTTGGATLSGTTWTYDATANRAVFAASTVTWTSATFTARQAIVYKSTGTAATSRLVGVIDFGADKSYVAEDFPLAFPNGVMRIKSA